MSSASSSSSSSSSASSPPPSSPTVVFGDAASSDVVFVVGESQTRMLAHRALLSSASGVFAHMFSSAAMFSNGAMQLEIAVDACEPVVFGELLHWLYHAALSVPSVSALRFADTWALLELSATYKLDELARTLEDAVADLLSVKTCCALWLLAVDIQNERLAHRCAQYFNAHADDIAQSRYFDGRVLALMPMPKGRRSNSASSGAASGDLPDVDNALSVPPPPPLPVPDLSSVGHPLSSALGNSNSMLSLAMRRRSSDVLHMIDPHDHTYGGGGGGNDDDLSSGSRGNDTSDVFDLFDSSMSALSSDQLALFPGLPQSMTPFNAMPTAFASLGDAMTTTLPPAAAAAAPAPAAPENTLRTGPSIATRMPLLQGTVWWQTVDQLRVMLESLRLVVQADIATLFLYDDVTDELYARILTSDGSLCEIALPASLGLVGAAFTTRSTINTCSPYDDPRFYRGIDEKLGSRTRAIVATPIMTSLSTRPIGVLEVLNAVSPAPFTDANVREVELVSRMAAKLVEIAVDRVKATVASHIDAINTQIDAANAAAASETVVASGSAAAASGVGGKRRTSSSSGEKAALSDYFPADLLEGRRTSDPLKRPLGPSDIFLQTGPLQMFDDDSLFPDPASRHKRMRPAAPVLHLRAAPK
jgi:hypothetical protein